MKRRKTEKQIVDGYFRTATSRGFAGLKDATFGEPKGTTVHMDEI